MMTKYIGVSVPLKCLELLLYHLPVRWCLP